MASKTTAPKARARALLVNVGNRPVDLPSTEPPPPPPPVDMLIGIVGLAYYDIGPTGLITAGPVTIANSFRNTRFVLTPTHLVTAEGPTFPFLYNLNPVNGTVVRSTEQPAVPANGATVTGATYAPSEVAP